MLATNNNNNNKQMKKAKCKPDVAVYNALLQAVSAPQHLDFVDTLLSDMRADDCAPDLATNNTLAARFIRFGKSARALQVLEDTYVHEHPHAPLSARIATTWIKFAGGLRWGLRRCRPLILLFL